MTASASSQKWKTIQVRTKLNTENSSAVKKMCPRKASTTTPRFSCGVQFTAGPICQ